MEDRTFASKCYDLIKTAVTVLVVIGHTAVMYTANSAFPCASGSRLLVFLTDVLYSFHMPAFFLTAGCVFSFCLRSGKYRTFPSFLLNKGKRLLIPYFAFGTFLVVPVVFFCGLSGSSLPQSWLRDILLASQPRHLWYLAALFWIFLTAYAAKRLTKRSFLLFGLSAALYFLLYRLLPWEIFGVTNLLQLKNAALYQLYFFAGIAVDTHFTQLKNLLLRLRWLLLLLPAAVCGIAFVPGQTPLGAVTADCFTKPAAGLLGSLMCVAAAVFLTEYVPRLFETRLYRWLKRNAFGIYLIHAMLLYVLYRFVSPLPVSPWLMVAAAPAAAIAVSGWLTELLRFLRLGFLIGEPVRKRREEILPPSGE